MKGLVLGLAASILTACNPPGEIIDASVSRSYYKTSKNVIYTAVGNPLASGSLTTDADVATFRPLSEHVGMDTTRVFYKGKSQTVDRASFQVVGLVFRDQTHVYFPDTDQKLSVVGGADPTHFEYLFPNSENPRSWARDDKSYYFEHKPAAVEYASFKFLTPQNPVFAQDKEWIYSWDAKRIVKVSGPVKLLNMFNLEVGDALVAKQPLGGPVVVPLNGEKATAIGDDYYVRVGQRVLYGGQVLPSADAHGFEVLDGTWAKDSTSVYFKGRHSPVSPTGLTIMSGFYARDTQHIVYAENKLDDVDFATFETFERDGWIFGRDKHGEFSGHRRVKE